LRRIRFALRSLSQAPLLSTVVVLSLGLGIGVNTAIFSLLYQVVLSSLPVPHPEQLVLLTSPGDLKHGSTSDNDSGRADYIFNWRTFRELEKHTEAAAVAGFRYFDTNLSWSGQTVKGSVMLVAGRYFDVLGVQPFLGRLVAPDDDVTGAGNPIAVLSYRYWTEKLNAQPDVLNQTIKVNGEPYTIVGIAPPGFNGTTVGLEPNLYMPISFQAHVVQGFDGTRGLANYWVYLIARLKQGVTLPQAEAALNGPYRAILEEMAATVTDVPITKTPRFLQQKITLKEGRQGNSNFRDFYSGTLSVLMLATGLVLLIAIANAANLLLARAAERRRELAIRAAMGAGRGELMGQFLTEALLLSCAGGVAGIVIGLIALRLLLAAWSSGAAIVTFTAVGINWPVLLFSIALSIATGILFGLFPGWDAARTTLAEILSGESGKASASRGSARLRKALVCVQVGISIVLLVPTGLFLKSLVNLLHVDLGIRTANVITFAIIPGQNGYKPAQSQAICERAETELAVIPGVRSAVGSMVPLLAGSNYGNDVILPGNKRFNSRFNEVGPGFFSKSGIALIAGREILDSDTAAAPKVAVVNESFVKKFFDGRSPIGEHIGFGRNGAFDTEIVGVVKDSHYSSVRQDPIPLFYRPWRQVNNRGVMAFYVRTELPPKQVVPQIRTVMRSIDPDVPLLDMRTLDEQVHWNLRNDELIMRLAAAFAVLATLLAMLGLYGIMAHGVARRTREIGIRMALGAVPARIGAMVMRDLLWILGFGLGIGIPGALAATRLIESRLFRVSGHDATIITAATLVLAITAVVAAWWPARRAARVNPLEALRYE